MCRSSRRDMTIRIPGSLTLGLCGDIQTYKSQHWLFVSYLWDSLASVKVPDCWDQVNSIFLKISCGQLCQKLRSDPLEVSTSPFHFLGIESRCPVVSVVLLLLMLLWSFHGGDVISGHFVLGVVTVGFGKLCQLFLTVLDRDLFLYMILGLLGFYQVLIGGLSLFLSGILGTVVIVLLISWVIEFNSGLWYCDIIFMGILSLDDDIVGFICFRTCKTVLSTVLKWKFRFLFSVSLLKLSKGSMFVLGTFL